MPHSKRGFNEKLDSLHSRMDQLYMLVADMRTAIHTMQKTIGSIEEVMESNFDFIPSWDSPRQPSADEATSKEQSTEEVVVANKEQDDEESVKSVSTDTNTQTETRDGDGSTRHATCNESAQGESMHDDSSIENVGSDEESTEPSTPQNDEGVSAWVTTAEEETLLVRLANLKAGC
jgi:hypothetical protein